MSGGDAVLGVDVGGTFTDFVLFRNGRLSIYKCPTTPDDPVVAMLAGLEALGVEPDAHIVHGSTVATNALLQHRGVRTAFVASKGFGDVLIIGRQTRPDLYALVPRQSGLGVPADLCFEVSQRVAADGHTLLPLDSKEVVRLAREIVKCRVESVAVCLHFSFLDGSDERAIASALSNAGVDSVSLSSRITPGYREFERASTTFLNAYVAPVMARYLQRLEREIAPRRLSIIVSDGGAVSPERVGQEAARTVLSGPAGGVLGASKVAKLAGFEKFISLDMGGTSTDVSVVPGHLLYSRDARIVELPIRLPMLDIHTVGAGGGSIARVDAGGVLVVGPESAGANPGPVCYGYGDRVTVTDANLVLGRLSAEYFLGGRMVIYPELAQQALGRFAVESGLETTIRVALGVVNIVDASMVRAIQRVSVERGYDPREFALVAFGGCGPLHACTLADLLGMPSVVIPRNPGVLSALGMCVADSVYDYVRPVSMRGKDWDVEWLNGTLREIGDLVGKDADPSAMGVTALRTMAVMEMRYVGQSYELDIPYSRGVNLVDDFHKAHVDRYGYCVQGAEVELVGIRIRGVISGSDVEIEQIEASSGGVDDAQLGSGLAWFDHEMSVVTRWYDRGKLLAGNRVSGPALIFQLDSTVVIPPAWEGLVDQWGNLVLNRK